MKKIALLLVMLIVASLMLSMVAMATDVISPERPGGGVAGEGEEAGLGGGGSDGRADPANPDGFQATNGVYYTYGGNGYYYAADGSYYYYDVTTGQYYFHAAPSTDKNSPQTGVNVSLAAIVAAAVVALAVAVFAIRKIFVMRSSSAKA